MELIENLVTSQFYLSVFFKFRNDVVVVSVEPFLHWKGANVPFFSLVTTSQSEVALKVRQVQVLNGCRHHVEKESRI
ncbi:Uncharacterised protein [Streptococcus pneumoniae]|nr:Uncharacterised protein [Streptococcus pneumoniae]